MKIYLAVVFRVGCIGAFGAHVLTHGLQAPADISELDRLAQSRDVEALGKLLAQSNPGWPVSPFRILKTDSVNNTGEWGWHAHTLGPDYVTFGTPVVVEQTGTLVFKRENGKLGYIPEDEVPISERIVHHTFDVRFDPPAHRAMFIDEVTLASPASSGDHLFRFDSMYHVRAVQGETGEPIPFWQADGVVLLRGALPSKLVFSYEGIVNHKGFDGYIDEGEALLTGGYWYPMLGRKPAAYDITIHTDNAWTAIAQGDLVSEAVTGDEKVTRYHMAVPVVYFGLSAAPYKAFSETVGDHKFSVYSHRLSDEQMKWQCDSNADVIDFYSRLFGPYPFKQWASVDSDNFPKGAALESYSFATYHTAELAADDAHEPAHSWWGGIVPNTYLHSLWNESFASFCDGMYHRQSKFANSEESRVAFIQPAVVSDFSEAPIAECGPEWGERGGAMGRKGALVLQMLEQMVGTETLSKCMRTWAEAHRSGSTAGTLGEWADFEKAVNEATRGSTKAFLDGWLRTTPPAVDFEVSNVRFEKGYVTGELRFTGPSLPFPCDVLMQDDRGRRVIESFTSQVSQDSGGVSSFHVKCDFKPTLVSIDPWRRILRTHLDDGAPVSINRFRPKAIYGDPQHPEYVRGGQKRMKSTDELPADLDGALISGSPESVPAIRKLCEAEGLAVKGSTLTYKGTQIDLRHGAAAFVADLGGDKHCLIRMGSTQHAPRTGEARLAVVDENGRFLRGRTDPKTTGWGVFKLP